MGDGEDFLNKLSSSLWRVDLDWVIRWRLLVVIKVVERLDFWVDVMG